MFSVLGHYTSGTGVRGIVEGKSLWASHVAFLNDASEFEYAFTLAREIIERINSLREDWAPRYPKLAELITHESTHLERGNLPDVFVTSLTTKTEDLSQWRGYTSAGDGYTVLFDAEKLRGHANALGWRLVPVQYEGSGAVAAVVEATFRKLDDGTYADAESAFRGFQDVLLEVAPTLKHHAFDAEHEWRLISPPAVDPTAIKWRSGASFLVPYLEFPLPQADSGVIVGFGVGPGPNGELASSALLKYINQMGHHVGVGMPGIPFRPW